MTFQQPLRGLTSNRKRAVIDLDASHCVQCLKDFPDGCQHRICNSCGEAFLDGPLPAATSENPLVYKKEDHSKTRLIHWLGKVAAHKGVLAHQLQTLSAKGYSLSCRQLEGPLDQDFPVSVHVYTCPRPAPSTASSSMGDASATTLEAPRLTGQVLQLHTWQQDCTAGPQVHKLLQIPRKQPHSRRPAVVHVLEVSRSKNIHHAFEAGLDNAALKSALDECSTEEILEALSEGRDGYPPKLFACPEVGRLALQQLAVQSVTLGKNIFFLKDLKSRHFIVEDHLLEDVKEVLGRIPGTDNVHVKLIARVEISNIGHICEHHTFIDVNLGPSSMWSQSPGKVTASTGELLGRNPRVSRRRLGSPKDQNLGRERVNVAMSDLPSEESPQAQHAPGTDSQSLPPDSLSPPSKVP